MENSGNSLVSIICPVYNKERFLGETITSVLEQTFPLWELVLIDDGSTDSSLEVCNKAAQQDKRVKVFQRNEFSSEMGANVCRNLGVSLSLGEHIIFLDADDILLPHCLERRLSAISRSERSVLYIFNVAYWKSSEILPYTKHKPSFFQQCMYYISSNKQRHFLKRFLKFDLPWHTSGPVWDKAFLLEIGGFNEGLQRLQDPEIHSRALMVRNLKFSYFMNEFEYDILHRMDIGRGETNQRKFLTTQLDSTLFYLDNIGDELEINNLTSLFRKLQGYLMFAETIVYRHIRDEEGFRPEDKYIQLLNETVYKCRHIDRIIDVKCKCFLRLYRWSLKYSLIKAKIPGLLLYLYRHLI